MQRDNQTMMFKPKQIRIFGSLSSSEAEIRDLAKAWIAISLAFAIAISGSIFSSKFYSAFIISSLTVGVGFIFHEMGHKIMAQRYGCFAEFRSFDNMLIMAVIMSFFGFIFAAPGAVMISGPVGTRRNGKISALGPATNFALALIFLSMVYLAPFASLKSISYYGFYINSWLGLFNMIPFWMFDGIKIWRWSKVVYLIMLAIGAGFMILLNSLSAI